ncbi:tetratricopeptide repeat protein [Actinoalloteichus hymeniacidonis]|uniref:tetratricopeptide repeat protein n=1 Tax=Actinoalloteichus hymeniacidonis TaxID=340345 RepID=UPI000853326D|nr:tetratricopeptide repeat protein [Actinoalloteichus hymeniacidonis]MBB5910001.1 hypothetical protein [Actinoalloteichus hymeniacidonis]
MITGLGGVGKTQLAAEHARQSWQDRRVDLLVWITADSREAIVSSYASAARKLGQSTSTDEHDDAESSRRFLEWLDTTDRRWLIVLDDVQNPAYLRDLWPPQQPTGRVLVTSRRQDSALAWRGHLVEIGLFTSQEATDYLHAVLAQRPALIDGAAELAAELGCLPLALAQAAAYLLDRRLSCSVYLQRFTDRRRRLAELFPRAENLPDDHHTTLATTWSLSIQLADQLEPAGLARPLLELAAMLDPNGIPKAVLTAPAALDYLTSMLSRTDPLQAEDAADALHNLNHLSLAAVDFDDPNRSVRVHALVQRATRDQLSDDNLAIVAHAAADALLDSWPEVDRDNEYGQALRANSDAVQTHGEEHLWHPNIHPVLFHSGASRGKAGFASDAAAYFQHLHEHAVRVLGSEHPNTLTVRSFLAGWQAEEGDAFMAIVEFESLLADQARILGPDHPDTLNTHNNLAVWRAELGDTAGAAVAIKTVLPAMVRVLGPYHSSTLSARGILANLRGKAGDVAGAVAEYEAILAAMLRILSPDHPRTLKTRSELANWRAEAGDTAEAIIEFEALVADRSRILGPDHPDTLNARNALAVWRARAGEVVAGALELEEVFRSMLRVLGPAHLYTLNARENLRSLQQQIGEMISAIGQFAAMIDKPSSDRPHAPTRFEEGVQNTDDAS